MRYDIAVPVVLAALIGITGCHPGSSSLHTASEGIVICPDGATVDGIDVSYWQGTIDWNAVAGDGIEFTVIRVSDGLSTYDTQFQANWANARAAGIVRGAYQYFRPGQDPVAQAELLLSEMGPLQPGDLPPVIDVETTDGYSASHVADAVSDWIYTVEVEIGRMPIIYTGSWFWESSVASGAFADYPLWIAHWHASCPDTPDYWNHWEFWQTSCTGWVNGISGNVDTNLFNGDLADLLAFAEGEVECGDGICNGDETPETCPEDCPSCEAIPAAGRAVDETEECFEAGGNPQWWRYEDDGHADSLMWTHTTDSPDVDNYGIWDLQFEESGLYRVEAYTAAPWAQSQQARYEIQHGPHTTDAVIDQGAVDGWNELGEFEFETGHAQSVRLDDNTGEPYETSTQIVYDALRLTRLDDPGDDDTVGDDDTASDGDDDTAADDDVGPSHHPPGAEDDGGCSCDATGCGARWLPIALLAAVWLIRRRS